MDPEKLLAEKRSTRKANVEKIEQTLKKSDDEKRTLSDDEKKLIDGLLEENSKLDVECVRLEKLIAEQAKLKQGEERQVKPPAPEKINPEKEEPEKPKTEIRNAFRYSRLKAFRGDDAEERAYASGRWLAAVLTKDERSAEWCREHGLETRSAVTTSNTLGGYLVPAPLEQSIIDLREDRGVFRRQVRVRPMTSDTLTIPRRSSGVTAYFVSETSDITASDKGWDAVSLTSRKLAVLCKYSSEIAEDAFVSIADDLATEIAYAFADKEDECGFNGDGTSTYGGIVGLKNAVLAGSKYTAITGNTAFGTLDLEDFEAMVGKLPVYAQRGAAWYISNAGWANSMLRLQEAAGGNTNAMLAAGVAKQFMGYPVVITQVMNSTTSAQTSTDGLVYFGNLDMAASMGARRGVTIAVDSSRYFESDQLAIRGTQRFDINVHEKGTASVAGPVIMLSTPSS